MVDLLIPLTAYISIIAVLCLALSQRKLIKIKLNWSLVAIALFSAYVLAPSMLNTLLPLEHLFAQFAWPWADKFSVITCSFLALLLLWLGQKNLA